MNYPVRTIWLLSLAAGCSLADEALRLQRIAGYTAKADTAEIVAYDASRDRFFATYDTGIEMIDSNAAHGMTFAGNLDCSSVFGSQTACRSVSSVAVHSQGGYGAAAVIPTDARHVGKIVFFDTGSGQLLKSVDVGFHPDMLTFNEDYTRLLVANEGEPTPFGVRPKIDMPGSLSVLDVSGLSADLLHTAEVPVETVDFSEKNLDGISLSGLRINPANAGQRSIDVEPEYITVSGDKAFVVLQENNAIAVFDLSRKKWTALFDLGTIRQTIDASDKDDLQQIDDSVSGLPMPDGIASWTVGSNTFLITANEGDLREDFVGRGVESLRYADAVADGRIDPLARMELDSIYRMKTGENSDHKTALGRLTISLWDGDTDADGDIDEPTMFGTRSLSIWDANSGDLLGDTGSGLEEAALAAGCWNESRCDRKGPEPEAVVVKKIGSGVYAFAGVERTGNVVVYDVTDPRRPRFVTQASNPAGAAPESLKLFKKGDGLYLAVAYEGSGSIDIFRINTTGYSNSTRSR